MGMVMLWFLSAIGRHAKRWHCQHPIGLEGEYIRIVGILNRYVCGKGFRRVGGKWRWLVLFGRSNKRANDSEDFAGRRAGADESPTRVS